MSAIFNFDFSNVTLQFKIHCNWTSGQGGIKGWIMKLFCLRLNGKLNLILKFQPNRTYVSEILPMKDSLYFIVFANILIKLMRKIVKTCQTMPAPRIKLCAIAAYHLFHSHAQVLTFTDSTR